MEFSYQPASVNNNGWYDSRSGSGIFIDTQAMRFFQKW